MGGRLSCLRWLPGLLLYWAVVSEAAVMGEFLSEAVGCGGEEARPVSLGDAVFEVAGVVGRSFEAGAEGLRFVAVDGRVSQSFVVKALDQGRRGG